MKAPIENLIDAASRVVIFWEEEYGFSLEGFTFEELAAMDDLVDAVKGVKDAYTIPKSDPTR